jgi:hypothetical protein
MHRAIKPDPHYLRDAARIKAVNAISASWSVINYRAFGTAKQSCSKADPVEVKTEQRPPVPY